MTNKVTISCWMARDPAAFNSLLQQTCAPEFAWCCLQKPSWNGFQKRWDTRNCDCIGAIKADGIVDCGDIKRATITIEARPLTFGEFADCNNCKLKQKCLDTQPVECELKKCFRIC